MIHTIKFNKPVTFTGHQGVRFEKNIINYIDDPYFNNASYWGGNAAIEDNTCTIPFFGGILSPADPRFENAKDYTVRILGTGGITANISIRGGAAVPVVLDGTFHEITVTGGSVVSSGLNVANGTGESILTYLEAIDPLVGEVVEPVTSASVSPNNFIDYDVVWVADPVANDVVVFRYFNGAAGANYEDADGVAMASGDLTLINCLDASFWSTEEGGSWDTEAAGVWELENV